MAKVSLEEGGDLFRLLRRVGLAGIVLVAISIFSCASTARIDAAHVGIRVRLAGSARGVDDIPVVTGWVWFNPLTEQIIEFPTSVQNVIWTASAHEGRTVDESLTFSSQEGVNVNADIGLSFHIDPSHAPHLYLRFHQPDMLILADGYIRNAVREAFSDVSSKMVVQEIYGSGKAKLVADVSKELLNVLGKDGVIIDQVTINGALRLPPNVATAINRAMEATQNSIQAENRVRQVRAEADQAIAEAHGAAEASRERARGEADAVLLKARAEAKANQILRYSTSPTVLQYRALDRWDGKLPTVNNGPIPMLTIDASKLGGNDKDQDKRLDSLLKDDAPAPTTSASTAPAAPAAPASSAQLPKVTSGPKHRPRGFQQERR